MLAAWRRRGRTLLSFFFFFKSPRKRKSCSRVARWLETLCRVLCCQLRNISSPCVAFSRARSRLSSFLFAFVLADNKPGGAEKDLPAENKSSLTQKESQLKLAELRHSRLAQFTPQLRSLHRICKHNTLKHKPSSFFSPPPLPSSFPPFFYILFLIWTPVF